MRRIILSLTAVAVAFASCSSRPEVAPFVGDDPTRLEIRCVDPSGNPVSGISLVLCREPEDPDDESARECRVGLCDRAGRALFEGLRPGDYSVTADETGWATTTVGGFGLGGSQPAAPRVLTLTMNPVCFDCQGRDRNER